ncbi:hypothetical protein P865_13725 [Brucella abortus 82]|uniref:Uncharacterized protein n=2 Tax=Brucella TaxID=234 RepID=A0A0H3AQW6_BRUO2|nr:hypothetical protein BOV_0719 [Brucella ovis ATCC 25840]AEQ08351.1 hypothetical protein BMNI_I0723 [Brucella melitensis NI]AIB24436.1 Hypothetical protein BSPT2_I0975 [Brucella suis bv. 2]EEH14279.1 Hypothetical protein, conserved [Brucella ceti str. Cudo]ERM06242.1 hypothetical protein P408_03340 [Brucella abortus S99]ERM85469.1 hypothetical protein P865_13725 [Brucella abortus 82]EXU83533.1 hypothetical protein AX23_05325 [Brucella melitensis 548]GFP63262.1 hypothetical protein BCBD1442
MSLLLPFSISIGDEWRLIPDIMHVSTSQKQVKHPLFELALKHDPARMIIRRQLRNQGTSKAGF